MTYSQVKDYVEIMTDEMFNSLEIAALLRNTKSTLKMSGNGRIKWRQNTERVWIIGDPSKYRGRTFSSNEIRPMIEKVQKKLDNLVTDE